MKDSASRKGDPFFSPAGTLKRNMVAAAPKKSSSGFGAPKKAAAKSDLKRRFDKHLKLFKSLEDPEDRSNMCDCYVRAEGNDKFWFVGKAVAKAAITLHVPYQPWPLVGRSDKEKVR